jgi:pimeloyl-ACP methyl ester carboxylesterase
MRYLRLSAGDHRRLPALVFVHGLMGYSFSWRHNLEFFARQREVCAVDLLGMGHSDRPEAGTADYRLEASAARLLRLLRSLGRSQVDLVATSHGGAVAMLAASQDRASPRPMIRRLALIAPAHPFMPEAHVQLASFLAPFGGMFCNGLASWGAAVQDHAMGLMYSHESRLTAETRAGYAVNYGDARSYEYVQQVMRSWRADMRQLQAALPSIASMQALLLWGADDETVSAGSGLELRKCFSHARFLVLPGVGHLPYEEAPAEFNRCLLQFLGDPFVT